LVSHQNYLQGKADGDDTEARAQAGKELGSGGSYGEASVTKLIYDRVKAFANGDATKIDEMKAAVAKGFEEAKKAAGGKLAEVSQITYNDVMLALDSLKNEAA
jgi:hypothetical protein